MLKLLKTMATLLILSAATPLTAGPDDAPTLPYFYRVVGVASDDVLNIRAEPSSRSPIIGAFAHDEPLIEITGRDGKWFRVNEGETSGWAYSKYLSPVSLPKLQTTSLPDGLKCFGEEPFWDVWMSADLILFEQLGLGSELYEISSSYTAGVLTQLKGTSLSGEPIEVDIWEEACASSMIDHNFNWSVAVTQNGSQVSGAQCCLLGDELPHQFYQNRNLNH